MSPVQLISFDLQVVAEPIDKLSVILGTVHTYRRAYIERGSLVAGQ